MTKHAIADFNNNVFVYIFLKLLEQIICTLSELQSHKALFDHFWLKHIGNKTHVILRVLILCFVSISFT